MFGLLIAAISFVLFVAGFLVGALLVIAVRINLEDKAARRRMLTTQRLDGAILLHEEPQGSVSRGVRWMTGAGQRNGPGQLPR
jgi:hypothetical protein